MRGIGEVGRRGGQVGLMAQRMHTCAMAECSLRLPPQTYSKRKCSELRVMLADCHMPTPEPALRVHTAVPTSLIRRSDAPSARACVGGIR